MRTCLFINLYFFIFLESIHTIYNILPLLFMSIDVWSFHVSVSCSLFWWTASMNLLLNRIYTVLGYETSVMLSDQKQCYMTRPTYTLFSDLYHFIYCSLSQYNHPNNIKEFLMLTGLFLLNCVEIIISLLY